MTAYPTIPLLYNLDDERVQQAYNAIETWANGLVAELDNRDLQQERTGSFRINRVVSIGELGQPQVMLYMRERQVSLEAM